MRGQPPCNRRAGVPRVIAVRSSRSDRPITRRSAETPRQATIDNGVLHGPNYNSNVSSSSSSASSSSSLSSQSFQYGGPNQVISSHWASIIIIACAGLGSITAVHRRRVPVKRKSKLSRRRTLGISRREFPA